MVHTHVGMSREGPLHPRPKFHVVTTHLAAWWCRAAGRAGEISLGESETYSSSLPAVTCSAKLDVSPSPPPHPSLLSSKSSSVSKMWFAGFEGSDCLEVWRMARLNSIATETRLPPLCYMNDLREKPPRRKNAWPSHMGSSLN